jgi:hypothetical protein
MEGFVATKIKQKKTVLFNQISKNIFGIYFAVEGKL